MLNINKYVIKAKYIPTKRIRKVTISARTETEAVAQLGSEYDNVVSIELDFKPPSERQIAYANDLGIEVTPEMCSEDVSCLISSKTDDKRAPKQGLIDFADSRNIVFSSYIGKKRLYSALFHQLPQLDRIAFFIFCVYRDLSNDRESNMDLSPYKNYFYTFAEAYVNDNKFVDSLSKNYDGENMRFFGNNRMFYDDGSEIYVNGGSKTTYAYRHAKDYLNQCELLPKKVSQMGCEHTKHSNGSEKKELDSSSAGCLLSILIAMGVIAILF